MHLNWKSIPRCSRNRAALALAVLLLLLLLCSQLSIYEFNDGVYIDRRTCAVRAVPLSEVYSDYSQALDAYTVSHPAAPALATRPQGGKVGLLMMYDKKSSYQRIIRNRCV